MGSKVPVKNGHKPRRVSRSSGPLLGLLALAATLFVVAYEWRLHTIVGDDSSSSPVHLTSTRRSVLSTKADEAEPLKPGKVWDEHSVLLLEGGEPLADKLVSELQQEVKKVAAAIVVTVHRGREASALAAAFNVLSLPAVVYLPPNCIAAVADECRPHVYQPQPGGEDTTGIDAVQVAEWLVDRAPAYINLINDSYETVTFTETLDGTGQGQRATIRPRDRSWLPTKLGAVWSAVVNGSTVQQLRVMHDSALAVRRPGECTFFKPGCELEVDKVTFTPEMVREREDFSIDRQRLLVDQPPRTANFTRDGFKITRTPPLLLDALQSFFEITKYNYSREVWSPRDTYVNHHEVTNLLVDLPEDGPMRDSIFAIMKGIMERWSGKRLKNSAIYGVRVYRRGSMLHNHVDRSDTHIISAIVNVAQQVEKPWPVYVLDHHGVEHYVEMQPGDMVLYEGASCSHGRERPLVGNWFANVFIHMAPVDPFMHVPGDPEEDEQEEGAEQ